MCTILAVASNSVGSEAIKWGVLQDYQPNMTAIVDEKLRVCFDHTFWQLHELLAH